MEKPQYLPIKWLKLEKFCELTGETRGSVHARRECGEWLDSIHVQKREGRIYVSIDAFNRWVEHGLSKTEGKRKQARQARQTKATAALPKPESTDAP